MKSGVGENLNTMNRFFDNLTAEERRELLDLRERLKVERKGAAQPQIQRKAKAAKSI